MKRTLLFSCAVVLAATQFAWAQTLAPAKPEEVGLSTQRLEPMDDYGDAFSIIVAFT